MKAKLIQLGLASGICMLAGIATAAPQQAAINSIQFQQYADWHGHRDGGLGHMRVNIVGGDRWDRGDRRDRWDRDRWDRDDRWRVRHHRDRDRDDFFRTMGAVMSVMAIDRGRTAYRCEARHRGTWFSGRAYGRSGPCYVRMNGRTVEFYNNWRFAY